MARKIDFKFNEPNHMLQSQHETRGKPYIHEPPQGTGIGENFYETIENRSRLSVILPVNRETQVKGHLKVIVNPETDNRMLFDRAIEDLVIGETRGEPIDPAIPAHSNLHVIIKCDEVSSDKPFIVQLRLE